MLSTELKKLKDRLEGKGEDKIDKEALLMELKDLDQMEYLQESLSLSGDVCPTCGRKLR